MDMIDEQMEADVRAVKGALKSKLVWLGIVQQIMALFQIWANGGEITTEAVTTLIAGILTIILRAVTTKPLSEK